MGRSDERTMVEAAAAAGGLKGKGKFVFDPSLKVPVGYTCRRAFYKNNRRSLSAMLVVL